MKITFLSSRPNLSGGQRVIAIYADQLVARGHDVVVVARSPAVRTIGSRLHQLARGRKVSTGSAEAHFDRMRATLIRPPHSGPITAADVPDADIVISTWWETAFEAVHFPACKGRKVYFVQHHEIHSHLPKHISAASYLLPLKKITIASWLVDMMRERYNDNEVCLIPNAVDHSLFFASERLRQSVPTVGLMYSAKNFKGVDVALRAIDIARQVHPQLRVVAFGTERPAKDMPLPQEAEFHRNPQQESLRDIYASCDVFISASRSEGFGLPILEAMACRTPVIATRTGCASDVIQDGENGYVVDVDDVASLGARLTEVLSLDGLSWKAMSESAHQKALEYTWDEAGARFESTLLAIAATDHT